MNEADYKKGWENGKEAAMTDARIAMEEESKKQLEEAYTKGFKNAQADFSPWLPIEEGEIKVIDWKHPLFKISKEDLMREDTIRPPDQRLRIIKGEWVNIGDVKLEEPETEELPWKYCQQCASPIKVDDQNCTANEGICR